MFISKFFLINAKINQTNVLTCFFDVTLFIKKKND